MGAVRMVRLELSDRVALESVAHAEPGGDAASPPRTGGLPPNVNRRMLDADVMDALRRTAARHEIDDLHLRVVTHALARHPDPVPVSLHFALAFRHRDLVVTGPVFVSVLAAAGSVLPPEAWRLPWAAPLREVRTPLPPAEREALLRHYLREYLLGTANETDLTVICVPAHRPQGQTVGPTRSALAALACRPMAEIGAWEGHFLAHATWRHRPPDADPHLMDKLDALLSVWSDRSRSVHGATPDEHKKAAYTRLVTVVDRLRADWRAGCGGMSGASVP